MKIFIAYNPVMRKFEVFEDQKDAVNSAKEMIKDSFFDGWEMGVEGICVAEITHISTQENYVKRPPNDKLDDDMNDKKGINWCNDHDYICEYEIKPVKKDMEA